jgi:exodeoxyribonuclease V beta subunit
VIAASAGTGKTFAIENLVVDLLVRGNVAFEQILVLTFTERAATELRKRIRHQIETILTERCNESNCQHHKPDNVWWIDEAAERRLHNALSSFDAASISTIHGFFSSVLIENAFNNNRLFEGELADGNVLFRSAFMTALRHTFALEPGNPASLLRTWLEQNFGRIEELEELLFKCKAAQSAILPSFSLDCLQHELRTNVLYEINLADAAGPFEVSLKEAGFKHTGSLKAITSRLRILDQRIRSSGRDLRTFFDNQFQDAVSFIAERIPNRPLSDPTAVQIAQAIVRLKNHMIPLNGAIVQSFLPAVREILEWQKAGTGQFDYDDIISDVAKVIQSPRGEQLTQTMRSRYRFALIDEFQDTDVQQWLFFHRVFLESRGRNLIHLIGDPKQAIYGFRGADVFTYQKACEELKDAGAVRAVLSENYRSTCALIDAYNHILDPSAPIPFFNGRNRYDEPVVHGREQIAEEADGSPAVPIYLFKVEPQGEQLDLVELRRALARQIAREVRRILSSEQQLRFGPKGNTEPVKPKDIFVLVAKNKDAAEISDALRELEVPFAFYKQDGLFQTREARHVRDILLAIDDPADQAKRGRAWITPFFAVPLDSLPDLAGLTDAHPLVDKLIRWKDEAVKGRFERLFTQILDQSGIIRRELFLSESERSLTNYLHLFELLLEEARVTGCELQHLVRTLDGYIEGTRKPKGDDGNVQRLETDRDAVQIMTIHKSKGLEAAVVFLAGGYTSFRSEGMHHYHDENGKRVLDFGENPNAKEASAREQFEEYQRLNYVAITRAKARLYLPYVALEHWDHRSWRGSYRLINERLGHVVSSLAQSDKAHLFRLVPVRGAWAETGSPESEQAERDSMSWEPSPLLSDTLDDQDRFQSLRRMHGGYQVTSYSRMKSALDGGRDSVPLGRQEPNDEPEAPITATAPEGKLPGGTAIGTMLHEILEGIPLDSFVANPELEGWRHHEQVADVINTAMARNAVDPVHRDCVETMVHHALTLEIPITCGMSIPGLYRCQKCLREVEFLFPDLDGSLLQISSTVRGERLVNRGFIKGFIDLVVEYDGLVYFADWKSDILTSYKPQTVEEHVALHYTIQIQLYVIAIIKALRIGSEADYEACFGGLIYIFLRGLLGDSDQNRGVYFHRPSWVEVLSYEKDIALARSQTTGGRS